VLGVRCSPLRRRWPDQRINSDPGCVAAHASVAVANVEHSWYCFLVLSVVPDTKYLVRPVSLLIHSWIGWTDGTDLIVRIDIVLDGIDSQLY